jgi:hypothetical protein
LIVMSSAMIGMGGCACRVSVVVLYDYYSIANGSLCRRMCAMMVACVKWAVGIVASTDTGNDILSNCHDSLELVRSGCVEL